MHRFTSQQPTKPLEWSDLGDIALGRKNLGEDMPVAVYRLCLFSLREVLTRGYGVEKASEILRQAGFAAGQVLCKRLLDKKADFDGFVAGLQRTLKDLKIGILRVEKADLAKMEFYVTVEEDLDCSGLAITEESVCDYDEGFLAGVLHEYTGKVFRAVEIDCWASGARTCRFRINEVMADRGAQVGEP